MSDAVTQCPNGHRTEPGNRFCSECGAALLLQCANGHPNKITDHYCGQCGVALYPFSDERSSALPAAQMPDEPVPGPDPLPAEAAVPSLSGETQAEPSVEKVVVGLTFLTLGGQNATVRAVVGDDVWVDVYEHGREVGTFRFSVASVEEQLARSDWAAAAVVCPNGHSNPATRALCRECQASLHAASRGGEVDVPRTDGTVVCAQGHHNPATRTTCRECSVPLAADPKPSRAAASRSAPAGLTTHMQRVPTEETEPGAAISPSESVTSPKARLENESKKIVIGLAAVLGLIVLIIVGSLLLSDPYPSNRASKSGASNAGAGQASSGSLFDDWIPSVCKPGSYFEKGGELLPNAYADGFCQSTGGNPIIIGQYTEKFTAQNDMSMFRSAGYAVINASSGQIYIFLSPTVGTAPLEPLAQYGFQFGTVAS